MHTLPCVQGALALLLGMQAVAVASLLMWLDSAHPGDGRFALSSSHGAAGVIDARVIALVTLALGATMQALALVVDGGKWLRALRWLESLGCVPATLMAVALEAGVRDVYTLLALFGLAWASQVLAFCADGWLQQAAVLVASVPSYAAPPPPPSSVSPSQMQTPYYLSQPPPPPRALWVTATDPLLQSLGARAWVAPYLAAWFAMQMAYAPILINVSMEPLRTESMVLVCGQWVLLGMGSAMQLYELNAGTACVERPAPFETVFHSSQQQPKPHIFALDDDDEEEEGGGVILSISRVDQLAHLFRRCNLPYTILSFLSKTLLCWSVIGPFLSS